MDLLNRTYSREHMLLYKRLLTRSHSVRSENVEHAKPGKSRFNVRRETRSRSSRETPTSSISCETLSKNCETLSDVSSDALSDSPLTDENGFLSTLGVVHMIPSSMPGFNLMKQFAKLIEQRGYKGYALSELHVVFQVRFKCEWSKSDVLYWIPYFPRIALLGNRVAPTTPFPSALKFYYMLVYFVVKVEGSAIRLVDFPILWMRTFDEAFSLDAFIREFHPECTLEEFALVVGFPRLQTVFFDGFLNVRLTEEATSLPFPNMKRVLLPPKNFPPHLISNRLGLHRRFWEEAALRRMDAEESENTPPTNGQVLNNAKQEPQRSPPTPQQCGLPPRHVSGLHRVEGARGTAQAYSGTSCIYTCSESYCTGPIPKPDQVHPTRPLGGLKMSQPKHHELRLQWQEQDCATPRTYQGHPLQVQHQHQYEHQKQQVCERQPKHKQHEHQQKQPEYQHQQYQHQLKQQKQQEYENQQKQLQYEPQQKQQQYERQQEQQQYEYQQKQHTQKQQEFEHQQKQLQYQHQQKQQEYDYQQKHHLYGQHEKQQEYEHHQYQQRQEQQEYQHQQRQRQLQMQQQQLQWQQRQLQMQQQQLQLQQHWEHREHQHQQLRQQQVKPEQRPQRHSELLNISELLPMRVPVQQKEVCVTDDVDHVYLENNGCARNDVDRVFPKNYSCPTNDVDYIYPENYSCTTNDVNYVPSEHSACAASDIDFVSLETRRMLARNDDSCANSSGSNIAGRNISWEKCSEQQRSDSSPKSEKSSHERHVPLKARPMPSPLNQGGDCLPLTLGEICPPPGLEAPDPRINLRSVVVDELSTTEWITIDDLILRGNVLNAWIACGRLPLWKLLKPFPDFVQEQDADTMYWKIKRSDQAEFEANLSEERSVNEKKPDVEATPATRTSSTFRVEDTPATHASSSFRVADTPATHASPRFRMEDSPAGSSIENRACSSFESP